VRGPGAAFMRYRFDRYTLSVDRRELCRGKDFVRLAPQVFDLLEYLIRNRERVVRKDELIASVWGGRIVSDAALTTRIHVTRTAIGDRGDEQRLIKTFPRKGVRFVGAVQEDHETAPPSSALSDTGRQRPPSAISEGPSVAVASFEHRAGDNVSEVTGQRLAEDVRINLTSVRWLRVGSWHDPTSSNASKVNESLGAEVRYLLRGSVQRLGRQCRVTAHLVDAASGLSLWADRYDTTWTDSFASQDIITEAIAHSVAAAILKAERTRALRTESGELGAWEAYQCGMWHMSSCDAAAIGTAQHYFQKAIDLDPHYAPGYSALAWASMMAASIYSKVSVLEGCEFGHPLVRRAIALDGSDSNARARLALIEFLKGDVGSAIEQAEDILSVEPDCASALGVKGAALISTGSRSAGRDAIGKFLRLSPQDPARPVRITQIATSYYLEGNYREAARIAKQVTRQYPQHPFSYRWLAAALGQLGRVEEASAALQVLRQTWPDSFDMYVAKEPPRYCSAEYKPLLAGLRKAGWKS
jgi:DNA-binding winged helix-turn-helix (wHTH) protein/tetratricopeptide (TPR) repeat protein